MTGLALALEPDPRAALRSGGDLHGVALRHALAPGAAAVLARLLDDRAVPATARARLREREETLRVGDDATAARTAGTSPVRCRARRRFRDRPSRRSRPRPARAPARPSASPRTRCGRASRDRCRGSAGGSPHAVHRRRTSRRADRRGSPMSNSSKRMPPMSAPPGKPRPSALPNVSYALRFSASESTSYAPCTSLKRSSAASSPGLRSGWYSPRELPVRLLDVVVGRVLRDAEDFVGVPASFRDDHLAPAERPGRRPGSRAGRPRARSPTRRRRSAA